jgi:hypothetical protein
MKKMAKTKNGDVTQEDTPETQTEAKGKPVFKIVTNVPVPEKASGRETTYPWADIPVGGSFFVPGKNTTSMSTVVSARSKANPGEKYTCRATKDGAPWGHPGKSGVAVFRVKDEEKAA